MRSPELRCVPVIGWSGRGHCDEADLGAVVCLTPLSNLGHCRKGSTLSFTVSFQVLKPGLYEVGSHSHFSRDCTQIHE